MASLNGKRIVVTGSAGAFGTAVIELLEQRGARVAGLDRAEPVRDGDLQCDITDAAAVAQAVREAAGRLGGIDAVVNNAGIGTASPISDGLGEHERATLDVNVTGTWNVTQAALPYLLQSRGHVVNVASMLAVLPLPYLGAYSASKRAVCALSDCLRAEHAGDGLTVSTVYPGYVATPIHTPGEQRSGLTLHGLVPEESVDQVARTIIRALERKPRDIATSRSGNFARRMARHFPRLVDRAVQQHMRRRRFERPAAWPLPQVGDQQREA